MGILSGTVAVLHSSLRTMSNYVRLFSSQLYALASLVHVEKKKKKSFCSLRIKQVSDSVMVIIMMTHHFKWVQINNHER